MRAGPLMNRPARARPYHSKDSLTGIFLLWDELKRDEAALLRFTTLVLHTGRDFGGAPAVVVFRGRPHRRRYLDGT